MDQDTQSRMQALEQRVTELERLLLAKPEPSKKCTAAQTRSAFIRQQCETASTTPIPIMLNRADFVTSWRTFCDHRTVLATVGRADGKKFDWTPRAAVRLLNKCEAIGPQRAIAAIEESLAMNYPDIYPRDENAPQSNSAQFREPHSLPARRSASL